VPASVDSIPTSGTTEDHVSMGWDAGLKLRKAIEHAQTVVAIEALCAAQALDLRAPLEPSESTRAVCRVIRSGVERLDQDRPLADDIAAVTEMVRDGRLVRAAEEVIGPQPWQVP
jgi:histidine ammonia-lyase